MNVELSYTGFVRTMFFNRIAVENHGSYKLMHFGYMTHHCLLGDAFSAAISDRDLAMLEKPLRDYLQSLVHCFI